MSIAGAGRGFPGRLAQAMAARGLSQKALGELIGAEQPVVGRWIAADGPLPGGKYLVQLPTALGVSGHWLLTGEGPMAPPTATDAELYASGRRAGKLEAVALIKELQAALLQEGATARPARHSDPTVAAVTALVEGAQKEGRKRRPGA